MAHQQQKRSLLGEMIANRLNQLGMSRREFCRRFNVSRPTLRDLEYNSEKRFAAATFEAIDQGMKWQAGTAYAFHIGQEPENGIPLHERIETYLEEILQRLLTMTPSELEREVLMLEEELYGRPLASDAMSLAVVRETVSKLLAAMTNIHDDTRLEPPDANPVPSVTGKDSYRTGSTT
jgi:transcriptional regulator with XRE-family HTH domain